MAVTHVIGGNVVRTQIQLTEDQYAALKRVAEDRGCSLAEAVRQAVDAWLLAPAPGAREELVQRALDACGRFRSGLRDLGSQHDRYAFD